MRVDTTKYQWAHGKTPRGYGYWAFEIDKGIEVFIAGKYSYAKKKAIKLAKEQSTAICQISVCP